MPTDDIVEIDELAKKILAGETCSTCLYEVYCSRNIDGKVTCKSWVKPEDHYERGGHVDVLR